MKNSPHVFDSDIYWTVSLIFSPTELWEPEAIKNTGHVKLDMLCITKG